MSIFQTFRDGPRYAQDARRRFWRAVWDLLNSILALALMGATAISYLQGEYQRATFDAVLVLWCLVWQRRSDNGS